MEHLLSWPWREELTLSRQSVLCHQRRAKTLARLSIATSFPAVILWGANCDYYLPPDTSSLTAFAASLLAVTVIAFITTSIYRRSLYHSHRAASLMLQLNDMATQTEIQELEKFLESLSPQHGVVLRTLLTEIRAEQGGVNRNQLTKITMEANRLIAREAAAAKSPHPLLVGVRNTQ